MVDTVGKASLCGHFELVQLLLESGALAERNTFQGERCIYNALNDRIRNLLLQYDFSKSSDPYVYWATHVSSLLAGATDHLRHLTDISLVAGGQQAFDLHKLILACRAPYFARKLQAQPEAASWRLSPTIPAESLQIALRYLYLGNLPRDLVGPGSNVTEEEVAKGLDKISKDMEIEQLWEAILAGSDRRLARQRYEDEVARARGQVDAFFQENVLGRKMVVDTSRVAEVKWKRENSIFADILLRADEQVIDALDDDNYDAQQARPNLNSNGIPIGPASSNDVADTNSSTTHGTRSQPRRCALYPAHKAMLVRSEYFAKMFSGDFLESQQGDHLRVVTVDCTPEVLELVLAFLYTESTDAITLDHALDLLYAADMLFLDALKSKAAVAISTLGSGSTKVQIGGDDADGKDGKEETYVEAEPINIYDVIRAAWDLRVQRLEEFAARYLADRLEHYIDEADFHEVIKESASRIKARQETDTIELLDDIRYYLSERFRHRFEDTGLEDVMDGADEIDADIAATIAAASERLPAQLADGSVDEQAAGVRNGVPTIDGTDAEDEFVMEALNYQILLGKIDTMLDRLKLDA